MTLATQFHQATQLEAAGQADAAAQIYQKILNENPNVPAAWHALGILVFNSGNLQQAFDMFANAVRLEPNNPMFHRNLGEISRRLGKLEQARLCGEAACKLAPKDVDAHYNLGLAYTDAGDYDKAIAAYKKAVKIDPKHGLSWNNLGSALEQKGDKKAALKAYEKAVALNAQHAEAQNNAGAIYSEQGKLDEARNSFAAAIAARPGFVESHYNLSSLKTYKPEDPHLAMLEGVYAQRQNLDASARIRYDFALGKALDDIGQYDRAFAAYDEGNRIQHALLPCDEDRADKLLQDILNVFTTEFFKTRQHWQGNQAKGKTPIFIVGMPRSGTTLLEQILCSHKSVFGAGELTDLNEAICDATKVSADSNFTAGVVHLTKEEMKRIGNDYIERVWKLSPKSAYITDKMPANFFYLGLIHLALPNAKIIHAMRDPMDSCFSCFSRLFNDTMEFAYDQETLGRYYQRYMTLMQHWHKVLPEGTILDLAYEDMVSDTEGQARRILKFVGLPWDHNCLEFYKNDRLVKTASVAQVRKPIYKTSVARWKHFARHLQPLLNLVRQYRNASDEPDISQLPPLPLLTSDVPADLANQCLALQGAGDHLGVVTLLAPHWPSCGLDATGAVLYHLNGISLYRLDRFEEARASYERSLAIQPNHPTCYNSLGFLLQDMGLMQEALAAFEKAIQLSPDMAMARLNLGMAQLKLGDMANGWENYEARWTGSAESVQGTFSRPTCSLPMWEGQNDVDQKSLLVITEQGFGDTFQFSRYLPLAASRFAKVGFVCSQPTLRLMEWAYNEDITLFTHMPRDYETWDYQCSLMSLPRAFQTRVDSIPGKTPYLKVPAPSRKHWQTRLNASAPGRFRIGIAWAGRKAHQYDARRSMAFNQLLPILNTPNITWVSLQKWAPEETQPVIPESLDWIDWTDELIDFADTAALLENLDLVISIDSSMVHLAGALGRPVWMMNRFDCEWRWFENRTDTPWYPGTRLFNQPVFGDWNSVVQQIADALREVTVPVVPAKPRARRAVAFEPQPSVQQLAAAAAGQQPKVQPVETSAQQPAPAPGNLTPEQALQLASQHQAANRLPEAENLLRQILKLDPQNAHALHLLGVVTYQAGQPILALDLIRQAIAIEPNAALFQSNLAEMSRQQGRITEAIEHGRRAVALDPTMASAHSNLGIALFDAKDYDEAEASHQRALGLVPNLLQSLNNLGSIERGRGNKAQALDWYRKALAINPDFLESLTNMGAVLVEDERPDEAIPPLMKVLQVYPESPEALCNLGLSYFKRDEFDKADTLLRRSLQNRAGYPEALVGLARVCHELDNLDEAESLLMEATEKAPEKADAWCQLGSIYTEQGQADLAEAAYQRALAADAKCAEALTGLANLKLEAGDIKEAVVDLEAALEIDPDNLGARFHLTQAQKVKKGDSNLAVLEAKAASNETLSNDKRISLHYALGKGYDDLKQYDKAFPHFLEGAKLKRSKLQYSAEADAERTDRIINLFTPEWVSRLQGAGNPDATPVFVLGMPRSGTTLTEQIIASHPQAYGAGELRDLLEVAQQPLAGQPAQPYPDNLQEINQSSLTQWGSDYLSRLRQHSPDALRITDKMPANYMALGLIPLMLPNAKIIHVQRNPVDTCLSCFTRLFNRHQDATYDLAELGRHYMNYEQLMQHWRSILPEGAFIDVQYEDIVADMEGQARRLIDYVGLDWHDACLDFHKTKRSVRTASVTQVRQPIYKTSVERWRHYEPYLAPLLEQLKPVL